MADDGAIQGVLRGGLLDGWTIRLNDRNAARTAIRIPLPGERSATYRLVAKRQDGTQVYRPERRNA